MTGGLESVGGKNGLAASLRLLLERVEDDAAAERIVRDVLAAYAPSRVEEQEPRTAAEWLARCREFADGSEARCLQTMTPLDEQLGGVYPGELVLVLGRWGVGKTAFGAHLFAGFVSQQTPAEYLSLEVPGVQMFRRMVQMLLGVTAGVLRVRESAAAADAELAELVAMLDRCGFSLADRHAIAVEDIPAEVDATQRRIDHRVGAVFVDHADYLSSRDRRGGNEAEVIRARYVALKSLAKQLDVVVVSLHQALDHGEWYEVPTARSSRGPLECADVAIGLVRDRQNAASEMYVELVKSRRSGPMLTAMRFEPETQRVVDYDAEQRLVACEELVRARR